MTDVKSYPKSVLKLDYESDILIEYAVYYEFAEQALSVQKLLQKISCNLKFLLKPSRCK